MNRNAAKKFAGIAVGIIAIFTLLAIISYLLHWKENMSLPAEYAGQAGSLGYKYGKLLVCDLFGLGSLAFVAIMAVGCGRLLFSEWRFPMMKTVLVSISGAVIGSFTLDFIGRFLSLSNSFGGGLGGRLGALVVDLACTSLGDPVTGLVIAALIALLLVLSSSRFCNWFTSLGEKKQAEAESEADPAGDGVQLEPGSVRASRSSHHCASLVVPPLTCPRVDTPPGLDSTPSPAESIPESPVQSPALTETPEGTFEIIADNEGLDTTVKEPLKPIDNRLDMPDGLPKFKFPPLSLLKEYADSRRDVSKDELARNNNKIRVALKNYRIDVNDVKAIVGPTVTLYKVYPAPGVQIAQIKRLQDDIALSLNAMGVRVVTLSDSVGIEVANDHPSIVPLRALLNDAAFRESKAELPVAIGYTITQKVKVFDLADAPHLLIAGATKQGKSVGLNVIVSSLLYSKHPSELKFVFIDPKMVEFSAYAGLLKHYLAVLPDAGDEKEERNRAIVKNTKDAERTLRSLCIEMDDRYKLLSEAGVNKITLYNEKYKERHLLPSEGHRYLPYLVAVVDEYADLTMSIGGTPESRAAAKSITASVIRLAQKGRAAGIHVILATQRPSVDVISGIIKSNFPMRIAFKVSSRVDSTTILDSPGAEKLIGKGDMIFSAGIESERIQCGYVDGKEIDDLAGFIGEQQGYAKSYNTPYYLPEAPENADGNGGGSGGNGGGLDDLDERFVDAANLVVSTQKASTSYLQTRLGMGFAKSARVMNQLEAAGIVSPQDGSKPRQVLVPDLVSLQPILDGLQK